VYNRRVIDEVILQESMWQLMGFSHPELDKLFYADIECTLVASVSGPFEFGLTVFGSANLYIDDKIVIDNTSVQRSGNFCFGKGTVEEKATVQLSEGTSYKLKVEFISGPSSKLVKPGVVNLGGGAGRLGMVQVVDPNIAIARAAEAAKRADVTVLCVGLTRDFESEGFDRPHMDLPVTLPPLINAVLAAAPNTILVTQSGSPFNMLPWTEQVKAHCHTWFGGNEVGHGLADVLFGAVNPSGKLPLSFPRRIEDTPTFLNFGSDRGHVTYGEGIYVGYRYYEKVRRDVLYPFG
jgi:beta-glucosidase